MQQTKPFDVIVVGGGMVGALCALLLAQAKWQVALLEQVTPSAPALPQARVSALHPASEALLMQAGVWSMLSPAALSAFERLQVWDGIGSGQLLFDAAELGLPRLGHIVTNAELVYRLWQLLREHQNVVCLQGTPQDLRVTAEQVALTLSDHTILQARLCVGADGANSFVREFLPGPLQTVPYAQQAIIALVHTQLPHQHTGWQVFLPEGPLALLPLHDTHTCALVWSQRDAIAAERMTLSDAAFEQALNFAFGVRLGELKVTSSRECYPLIMRHASHYVDQRLALVGDAAHTIHPLAGQGVNLGFMDVAALLQALQRARTQRRDIGQRAVLRHYERARKADNTRMIWAMRLLNELFQQEASVVVQARSIGLRCVNRLEFLRRYFTSIALR